MSVAIGIVCLVANTLAQVKSSDDHTWSYDGSHGVGPQTWVKVAPHAVGLRQSPIKLPVWNPELSTSNLPIKYGRVSIDLFKNNGHTWKGTFKTNGGILTLGGKQYKLVQFHFHAPSEHALNPHTAKEKQLAKRLGATESVEYASGLRSNFHFPMEMHLVHKSDDDKLVVIGVFIVPGNQGYPKDGAFMATINQFIKKRGDLWRAHGETKSDPLQIDMASFLPKEDSYLWYDGSLTTPPGSESVRWIVMREPISFHPAWIEMFKTSMVVAGNPYTSRPLQNPYGRRITPVYKGRPHAPPVGNVAGDFAGVWKGKEGTIVIGEALTVQLHNDAENHFGVATHQGDNLAVKYFNGTNDELRLVDETETFDDQLHSRKYGALEPFGEVADFVGEWVDDEFELLEIEEGIRALWTRSTGRVVPYVGEIRGHRLSLKNDGEALVFELSGSVISNHKYGKFSKP